MLAKFSKVVLVVMLVTIIGCSGKKDEIIELSKQGSVAIPEIANYLKDPDTEIRKAALFHLKNMVDMKAIPHIEAYINSAKRPVERQWGIDAINHIKTEHARRNPPPVVVKKPVNESDPLVTQINNFVHNLLVAGDPYFKGDPMAITLQGNTVINWTDMTQFYKDTQRMRDWITFYEYIRRGVLGYPTGDLTGRIFEKFPQINKFQQHIFVGEGEPEQKDGYVVYPRRRVIGKSTITRADYNRIDPEQKKYLDILSVTKQHFAEFEREAKKFVKNVWYDPTIAQKANQQTAKGIE